MLDTGVVFIDRYCNPRALLLSASASPAYFTDRQLAITSACLWASRPTTLCSLPSFTNSLSLALRKAGIDSDFGQQTDIQRVLRK